jgi:hypothetical protein
MEPSRFVFILSQSLATFTWAGLELMILLPPPLEQLGLQACATICGAMIF